MKIFNHIKAFIENPDGFIKDNPKTILVVSAAMKVLSFAGLIINTYYPLYFAIFSMSLFSLAIFLDYKVISNFNDLVFLVAKKVIQKSPYKTGEYFGRISATILKTNFLQRARGFYNGFKREIFN